MKRISNGKPDLPDRLLAAALAPLVFNVSVLVVLFLFFRGADDLAELFSASFLSSFAILLAVVPAAVGFAAGTNGFAKFLGHSFYTHLESERDIRFTATIWVVIFFLAYLLSRGVG